jgi:CBS domain-containing protein
VIGMLTETDFLRRLRSDSFLQLLLRMVEDAGTFTHHCHTTTVSEAMCAPVVTVRTTADFRAIVKASHEGRSMPVVDIGGRLQGLLLRKDFVTACHVGDPL